MNSKKLEGKKLLISGGISLATDIVEKAKEMGVYTIVADWDKDSPAKLLADESILVSTRDIEKISEIIKEKKINGVITQYIDSNLSYVQKICLKNNLYFFLNDYQLQTITNKQKAKELCIKNDIPVSKGFKLTNELLRKDLKKIFYPVLTKPVDNSGQRGITICNNEKELIKGFKYAQDNSESRTVVVEEYIIGDYVVLNYTLQNGYLSLSSMADKPVVSEEFANGQIKLPKAYLLPSKYIDLYYNTLHNKFVQLAKSLNLKDGSFSVEAVVKDNVFYVFEMQYRLGGMRHHNFVEKENKIDIMKMHINYALTGKFEGWDLIKLDNPYFKNTYCLLNILLREGRICNIKGLEELKKNSELISILPMQKIGSVIKSTGTVFQIFAKFSIVSKTKERLIEIIELINNTLEVLDEKGNNMIVESLIYNDLYI